MVATKAQVMVNKKIERLEQKLDSLNPSETNAAIHGIIQNEPVRVAYGGTWY